MVTTSQDSVLWQCSESIGLLERYESLVSSICYEKIEEHVAANCTDVWDQQMLHDLREWMSRDVVPWLVLMYAREAKTGMGVSQLPSGSVLIS